MPRVWQYEIREFGKNLLICLFGIVSLLLSTKLEEMARFIALGAPFSKVLLFVMYQIPYTLQIALPIAALISSFSVFSQMSQSGEMTAARSSGYSLANLLFPIGCVAGLLSILMMWVGFDAAAKSHFAAKKLEYDVREEEPLAFVQNSQFLGKHGVALELVGSLRTNEEAHDLLLCLPSSGDRLSLVIIQRTKAEKEALLGDYMSMISSKPPPSPDDRFGSLLIENADAKRTPTGCVHELANQKVWKVPPDYLPLAVVRALKQDLEKQVTRRQFDGHSAKKLSKELAKFTSEPFRRVSLSLAILTLSMIGAVFGIRTSRIHRKALQAIGPLVAFGFFIGFYLAGKNLDELPLVAILCYLLPHPILWKGAMIWKNRLEHGMEY
jgi:lipopolysaccharide export LptBFGC system permease protein LptF